MKKRSNIINAAFAVFGLVCLGLSPTAQALLPPPPPDGGYPGGNTAEGMRGAPTAKWDGNQLVAIWRQMKWGNEDLVVYELANDKIKREEKIWPEVVKYFDRDFHQRFLKKYPKESDNYTFVAGDSEVKNFEFKDHKLLLNISAENKPNLAPGPVWSAELHGRPLHR